LLSGLTGATAPTYALNEAFMWFPDYAVASLVGGLELSGRFQAPVSYTVVTRATSPVPLHWPEESANLVLCQDLQWGPRPQDPTHEQVAVVRSETELDRLTERLIRRYSEQSSVTTDCLFMTVQIAGGNALAHGAERTAYIGWALRGNFLEVAVGDSGVGIPATSRAATTTRLALQELVGRYDDRGRAAKGLTRLVDHWRDDVPHIEAHIISGDELHSFSRYNQSFRRIVSAGPTIVIARF
jgi:hypothetical protein